MSDIGFRQGFPTVSAAIFSKLLPVGCFTAITPEIDWLTLGGSYLLISKLASPLGSLSGKRVIATSRFMQVTALTGTVTGAPHWTAGNDGSHLNFEPAATLGTGVTTATVNQCCSGGGGQLPVPAVDMTTGDILATVSTVGTGTGLTVFKGKIVLIAMVLDL